MLNSLNFFYLDLYKLITDQIFSEKEPVIIKFLNNKMDTNIIQFLSSTGDKIEKNQDNQFENNQDNKIGENQDNKIENNQDYKIEENQDNNSGNPQLDGSRSENNDSKVADDVEELSIPKESMQMK